MKPHALCFPFPLQSHIKAMLKLSKLLHNKGFHITFVNTEFNHERFLRCTSFDTEPLPKLGFRFETIPDGLPPSNPDASQDIPSLVQSTRTNFVGPFLDLVNRLNDRERCGDDGVVFPAVSCLVVDGFMSFAVGNSAEILGIPLVRFIPISTNGLVAFQQYRILLERGILPVKDEDSLEDGTLENTPIDWVPSMKGLKIKDLPSFWRITDSNDLMFNFCMESIEIAFNCSALVLQTYGDLERDVLEYLAEKNSNIYTVGPLELLLKRLTKDPLEIIPYSLWKEETDCLKWLETKNPSSIIYVNFGSIMVLTPQQVVAIGWGLANSGHPFLWVIRPDLVMGESATLSPDFLDEIKGRSLITSWCPQEEVLNHSSVGGFLTHCGWNSVVESLSAGVPLLCLPFFAEQQTNSWLACNRLGVGIEIDKDVKKDEVEGLVRNLMEGEKGERMREKALELKRSAEEATGPNGSSARNFDDLVNNVLLMKK